LIGANSAALGHISRSDGYAVAADAIFVDIDTEPGPVEPLNVALRGWKRRGNDILREPRMRERQPPGNIGDDAGDV
jgi:hypothetical protein